MTTGIVVGHRQVSDSLIDAARSILGPVEDLCGLSNQGFSTRELADRIRECASSADGPVLVLVDVYGGSCWRAAKLAQLPQGRIVSGVNLPMLLSFANKRNTLAPEELAAVLADDGKRGIILEQP